MKETTSFKSASPDMKEILVLDGYNHLAAQCTKMSKDLKTLNTWVKQLPALIENGECAVVNIKKLSAILAQLEAAHDDLTSQFIDNHTNISALTKFLSNQRFL